MMQNVFLFLKIIHESIWKKMVPTVVKPIYKVYFDVIEKNRVQYNQKIRKNEKE